MTQLIVIPNYKTKSRNKTITAHWRVYQKARDDMAALVRAYAKSIKVISPASVTIVAWFKGKRGVDTSNIDDKLIVDGLMHAGILKDDTPVENPAIVKNAFTQMGEDKLIILVEEMPTVVKPFAK